MRWEGEEGEGGGAAASRLGHLWPHPLPACGGSVGVASVVTGTAVRGALDTSALPRGSDTRKEGRGLGNQSRDEIPAAAVRHTDCCCWSPGQMETILWAWLSSGGRWRLSWAAWGAACACEGGQGVWGWSRWRQNWQRKRLSAVSHDAGASGLGTPEWGSKFKGCGRSWTGRHTMSRSEVEEECLFFLRASLSFLSCC